MRPILLASLLLVAPDLTLANPQCALPPPAETAIAHPAPVRVGAAPPVPVSAPVAAPVSPWSPTLSPGPTAAPEPGSAASSTAAAAMGKVPVLAHIAAAGARLTDLGVAAHNHNRPDAQSRALSDAH